MFNRPLRLGDRLLTAAFFFVIIPLALVICMCVFHARLLCDLIKYDDNDDDHFFDDTAYYSTS